jgi:hypothetical protein
VTVSVIPVVLVKIGAGKQKRRRLPAVRPEMNLIKISTHAQEKSASE